MSWRDYAKEVQDARHNRHDWHNSSPEPPIVPTVPTVPASLPVDAARTLRGWHKRLSSLDTLPVPIGWAADAWRQACDDACWIYEGFASRAIHDGWSAADLFGVLPARPGWGGIVDRLSGARNLKMDTNVAAWSQSGIRDRFLRTSGDALLASGLKPIWGAGS